MIIDQWWQHSDLEDNSCDNDLTLQKQPYHHHCNETWSLVKEVWDTFVIWNTLMINDHDQPCSSTRLLQKQPPSQFFRSRSHEKSKCFQTYQKNDDFDHDGMIWWRRWSWWWHDDHETPDGDISPVKGRLEVKSDWVNIEKRDFLQRCQVFLKLWEPWWWWGWWWWESRLWWWWWHNYMMAIMMMMTPERLDRREIRQSQF